MQINGIHHIAIVCSDREKALNFYHKGLGFSVIRDNCKENNKDHWKIDLDTGICELEIFIKKDWKELDPCAYGVRHLSFDVDDAEQCACELKFRGIECDPVRTDQFTGEKIVICRDPDGLQLEFHE